MRHVWMAILVAATLFFFLAPSASAGGAWMGVARVDGTGGVSAGAWGGWGAPGATVTMRGKFCDGQQANPSAGPWTAYSRAGDSRRLQPLGQVTIGSAMGNACPYVASVTFVVPRVDPGPYYVQVCADARCDIGVGDLSGGTYTVATTALEARLLNENAALEHSVSHIDHDRDRVRTRKKSLEGELRATKAQMHEAEAARNDADAQLGAVTNERDALVSRVEAARNTANAWRWVAAGTVFAMIAFVIAMLLRLRRRDRIEIPDTLEELLTRADSR